MDGMNKMSTGRDEVRPILGRIFRSGKLELLSEQREDADWFVSAISEEEVIPYERPDAYVCRGNQILMIEHFEIDGYPEKKKGSSKLKENEIRLEREAREKLRENSKALVRGCLGEANTYTQFVNNCKRRFDKHYAQIDRYKQNLIESGVATPDTEFLICFLMEDVSPMGTWVCGENGLYPVCLGESREFLSFWKDRPNVDWILSAIETDAGYRPYFLSKNELDVYMKRARDYTRCQFLSSNTQCSTWIETELS